MSRTIINRRDTLIDLFTSAFEAWCHHLLYVRKLYPSESFDSIKVLGVKVKKCMHPKVLKYISDTIGVGLPTLLENASEVSLLIVIGPDHVETFTVSFEKCTLANNVLPGSVEKSTSLAELERCLQELIISVFDLERNQSLMNDDSTFKLIFASRNGHDLTDLNCATAGECCGKIIPIFKGTVPSILQLVFSASIGGKPDDCEGPILKAA